MKRRVTSGGVVEAYVLARAVPEKAKKRKRKVPANSDRKATRLWTTRVGRVIPREEEDDILPKWRVVVFPVGVEGTGITEVVAAMVFSEGAREEPILAESVTRWWWFGSSVSEKKNVGKLIKTGMSRVSCRWNEIKRNVKNVLKERV